MKKVFIIRDADPRDVKAVEMYKKGVRVKKIMKYLGIAEYKLYKALRNAGVDFRNGSVA